MVLTVKTREDRFLIFGRNILRKMFYPVWENDEWKILKCFQNLNNRIFLELLYLIESYGMVVIFRREKPNLSTKSTFTRTEGIRKRRRSHTRWFDCMETDLKTLDISRFRTTTLNRSHENCFIEAAFVCTRP